MGIDVTEDNCYYNHCTYCWCHNGDDIDGDNDCGDDEVQPR